MSHQSPFDPGLERGLGNPFASIHQIRYGTLNGAHRDFGLHQTIGKSLQIHRVHQLFLEVFPGCFLKLFLLNSVLKGLDTSEVDDGVNDQTLCVDFLTLTQV